MRGVPFLPKEVASPTWILSGCALNNPHDELAQSEPMIELPEPQLTGSVSVEQALKSRRSVRSFKAQPLTLNEVSQLLWAAQGMTGAPYRTAPSAGALYPLEIYVAVGNVEGLDAGVYHYNPPAHALSVVRKGDVLRSLSRAAYWQDHAGAGAIAIVFSAVYERTTRKYRELGIRFAHMEAGHAAQNVYLQAEALGLGTVVVGVFMNSWLKSVLQMKDDERPLSIMPVGKPMW
jgi:SagB-type dehydrogenase family enzyme